MLFNLPTEIIKIILVGLQSSRQGLLNLALTCQDAFYLVEPLLLKSIVVRYDIDVKKLDHLLGDNAIGVVRNEESRTPVYLSTRPDLSRGDKTSRQTPKFNFIKSLVLALGNRKEEEFKSFDTFLLCLRKAIRLEHLKIELPWQRLYTNDPFIPAFAFRGRVRRSLAQLLQSVDTNKDCWFSNLRSCHLNLQGVNNEDYDLPEITRLFLVPTMQNISISNAYLRDLDTIEVQQEYKPKLRSLCLDGCFFDSGAISNILSLICLTEFRLSFNGINIGRPDNFALEEINMITSALTGLRLHQIQHLCIFDIAWSFAYSRTLETRLDQFDLSSFSALEKVTIRVVARNHIPWVFLKLLPTSVLDLTIIDLDTGSDGSALTQALAVAIQRDRDGIVMLPNLKTLDLQFSNDGPSISPSDRRQLTELGVVLMQHFQQMRFRVFRSTECHATRAPYFYDDRLPVSLLLYNNYDTLKRFDQMWDRTSEEEDRIQVLLREQRRRMIQQEEYDPMIMGQMNSA